MIVECDQCETRFQLDDSRIPARGIRVRCSRCKHAFFLERPDASQAEALEDVATRVAQAGAAAPPESTQDLSAESVLAENKHTAPNETNAESADEDDWGFNHDDASDPSQSDVFGGASTGEEDFAPDDDSIPVDESSIDLADSDADGDADGESPDLTDQSPDVDMGFGGVDEMDALSAAEDGPATEGSLSDEARAAVDHLLGATPKDQPDSELGDPENWDFFSGDTGPDPAAAARVALPSPVQETGVAEPAARAEIGDRLDAYVAQTGASSRVGDWLVAAGRTAGWTVTVGLLVVGVVHGLFPQFQPIGNRTAEVRVGNLRISSVESAWIDTARSGQILSISGVLHNPSPSDAYAVDTLGVELLDDQGARLELDPGRAGHPLDADALRQLPPDLLAQAHARSVTHLGGTTLSPGASLPFAVLFHDVPNSARRFLVQGTRETSAEQPGASGVVDGTPPATASSRLGAASDAGLAASAAQALELAPVVEPSAN